MSIKERISLWFNNSMPMIKYIIKRLLLMIPVVLMISFVLFWIVDHMPGEALWSYVNPEQLPKKFDINAMREQYGLNRPFIIRYFAWIQELIHGNLGYSLTMRKDVADILPYYLKNSISINIFSIVLAFTISIIVGIKSAVRRYSAYDSFWTVFSLIGISMPGFFMAMLLIFVFVIIFPILPFSGMVDPGLPADATQLTRFIDAAKHMVLPVAVSTLGSVASILRYVRNAMLEVLKQDYIRTAKSKGLKDKVVIYRHAFRNALIPIITLIGFYLPSFFGGSVIVEVIFNWPGIGRLLNMAYQGRDRQIILTVTLFFAALTLLSNLCADIAYAFADPRVKVGGSDNE